MSDLIRIAERGKISTGLSALGMPVIAVLARRRMVTPGAKPVPTAPVKAMKALLIHRTIKPRLPGAGSKADRDDGKEHGASKYIHNWVFAGNILTLTQLRYT